MISPVLVSRLVSSCSPGSPAHAAAIAKLHTSPKPNCLTRIVSSSVVRAPLPTGRYGSPERRRMCGRSRDSPSSTNAPLVTAGVARAPDGHHGHEPVRRITGDGGDLVQVPSPVGPRARGGAEHLVGIGGRRVLSLHIKRGEERIRRVARHAGRFGG